MSELNGFDREEQTIRKGLSQIAVNGNSLAGQVKRRLNEEISLSEPQRTHRSMPAAAAIVLLVLLVTTATAVAFGKLDWFIEKFNPSFGEIVAPVEAYCEDQGIRMEVIGAQKYGNQAIVYLSLQDISGQNRLTEQTDFRDGFSVKMNFKERGADGQEDVSCGGFGTGRKVLYFDEETNTVYYEFNITADSPLSDPLELSSFLIYFDEKDYEDEPVSLPVPLSEVGKAKAMPIEEDQILGGSGLPDDWGSLTEALTPGNYAPLPHGEKDQWISNIGVLDGKLHVQTGKIFHKEFGSSDASLTLMAPDGRLIESDYDLMLLGDERGRLINIVEEDGGDAVYKYQEAVFSVNTEELDGYTLCYSGWFSTGVEGSWRVKASLSDTSRQMRIWTNDIPVEGHLFEHMTLSPLGLQVIGSYTGDESMASGMSLEVETTDGVIPLDGGGGGENLQDKTFNLHWNTEVPLDVTAVTAVIINGTRISVK